MNTLHYFSTKKITAGLAGLALVFSSLSAQSISLDWTQLGVTVDASAHARHIATDSQGNFYITGDFGNKLAFGTDTLYSQDSPNTDIFLVKYDSMGIYLWSKSFGSPGVDYSYGITTDQTGQVYICGRFDGDSLPLGNLTIYDQGDASSGFVAKLNPNGQTIWASATAGKSAFPSTFDDLRAVTVDNAGSVYVTGGFNSDTLYAGNLFTTMKHGPGGTGITNMYVIKYSSSGNPLWITGESQGSDPGFNTGLGITTDDNGNVYMTGVFEGVQTVLGQRTLTVYDRTEGVCSKLDPQNGQFVWVKAIRGYSPQSNTFDYGTGIFTDHSGHVYVGGNYAGIRCDFDSVYQITNPSNAQNPMGAKAFLFKLDQNNGAPIWGKAYGDNPSGDVFAQGWAVNANATRIALAGVFTGQPTIGNIALPSTVIQVNDSYFMEMDTTGTVLRGFAATGDLEDEASSVCYDPSGRIAGLGYFNSTVINFNPQAALWDQGQQDFFFDMYVFRTDPVATGLDEPKDAEQIDLYPNPATTEIVLSGSDTKGPFEISIYDNQGRSVFEGRYADAQNQVRISIAELPAGHYILHHTDASGTHVKSFVRL